MEVKDVVIIDPASPEFNRGSFCYLPYILHNALREGGTNVQLVEDFTLAHLDELPDALEYLIACWSPTQIEACQVLHRFLNKPHSFFGYPGFANKGWRWHNPSREEIGRGIGSYWKYLEEFEFLLLSDCDMHLRKYEGQVYPMFTSYGCRNACKFCPVSVACSQERTMLTVSGAIAQLNEYHAKGYRNIHFTDEDFFFDPDRTRRILRHMEDLGGFNAIALGSSRTVWEYLQRWGQKHMERAGLRLIEIGLESASEDMTAAMGKGRPARRLCSRIADDLNIPVLWLTLTFFPGEDIRSLNATGRFLKRWGLKVDDLHDRIKTNGTEGGLGQFYQVYPGTPGMVPALQSGGTLTPRPMRLLPSYVPHSFLESEIYRVRQITAEERHWFETYHVQPPPLSKDYEHMKIGDMILNDQQPQVDALVAAAIACRLCAIS